MGKTSLALRLADELGTTFSKASRFIDEVGVQKATKVADEAAESGTRTVGDWWKPATVIATLGTVGAGGVLYWREQDVRKAEALAAETDSVETGLLGLVESDLPPEMKRQLLTEFLTRTDQAGEGGGGGGGDSGDGGLFGGDVQMVLVLVVVLAVVLTFGGEE